MTARRRAVPADRTRPAGSPSWTAQSWFPSGPVDPARKVYPWPPGSAWCAGWCLEVLMCFDRMIVYKIQRNLQSATNPATGFSRMISYQGRFVQIDTISRRNIRNKSSMYMIAKGYRYTFTSCNFSMSIWILETSSNPYFDDSVKHGYSNGKPACSKHQCRTSHKTVVVD